VSAKSNPETPLRKYNAVNILTKDILSTNIPHTKLSIPDVMRANESAKVTK
jgi:hypothetical protein